VAPVVASAQTSSPNVVPAGRRRRNVSMFIGILECAFTRLEPADGARAARGGPLHPNPTYRGRFAGQATHGNRLRVDSRAPASTAHSAPQRESGEPHGEAKSLPPAEDR